mmetsp:Transcript_2029/g.3240  ORF Transcript_2029/g.3240 Transcript_2029/m.3240 type:complete len:200 (+) Transcript_2029:334-933(+)
MRMTRMIGRRSGTQTRQSRRKTWRSKTRTKTKSPWIPLTLSRICSRLGWEAFLRLPLVHLPYPPLLLLLCQARSCRCGANRTDSLTSAWILPLHRYQKHKLRSQHRTWVLYQSRHHFSLAMQRISPQISVTEVVETHNMAMFGSKGSMTGSSCKDHMRMTKCRRQKTAMLTGRGSSKELLVRSLSRCTDLAMRSALMHR